MKKIVMFAGLALAVTGAGAQTTVSHYDDFAEGFLGESFYYNGVTYRDLNNQPGVFPNGDTFIADDMGSDFIIENAQYFHDDFPGWGSPDNVLTFGRAFVPGPNLSIGVIVEMWMDLDDPASEASMAMGFYENGPWGGISYHLDAYLDGVVVASDSYTISDLGGRDNPAIASMSVAAAAFDTLHLYAQYNGQFSAPRLIMDDLTITAAGPTCAPDLNGDGVVDADDFFLFLSYFADGDPIADFNNDGVIDADDFFDFLAAFAAGC